MMTKKISVTGGLIKDKLVKNKCTEIVRVGPPLAQQVLQAGPCFVLCAFGRGRGRRRGLPTLPQELWCWGYCPGGRPSTGPPPEKTEGW